MPEIRIKRVYEKPTPADGVRILVDRLWPRGLRKSDAPMDIWLKGVAPSSALRKWFAHDPGKWTEFKRRYARELKTAGADLHVLRRYLAEGPVTFLYASKDERHNNAVALAEYLRGH